MFENNYKDTSNFLAKLEHVHRIVTTSVVIVEYDYVFACRGNTFQKFKIHQYFQKRILVVKHI